MNRTGYYNLSHGNTNSSNQSTGEDWSHVSAGAMDASNSNSVPIRRAAPNPPFHSQSMRQPRNPIAPSRLHHTYHAVMPNQTTHVGMPNQTTHATMPNQSTHAGMPNQSTYAAMPNQTAYDSQEGLEELQECVNAFKQYYESQVRELLQAQLEISKSTQKDVLRELQADPENVDLQNRATEVIDSMEAQFKEQRHKLLQRLREVEGVYLENCMTSRGQHATANTGAARYIQCLKNYQDYCHQQQLELADKQNTIFTQYLSRVDKNFKEGGDTAENRLAVAKEIQHFQQLFQHTTRVLLETQSAGHPVACAKCMEFLKGVTTTAAHPGGGTLEDIRNTSQAVQNQINQLTTDGTRVTINEHVEAHGDTEDRRTIIEEQPPQTDVVGAVADLVHRQVEEAQQLEARHHAETSVIHNDPSLAQRQMQETQYLELAHAAEYASLMQPGSSAKKKKSRKMCGCNCTAHGQSSCGCACCGDLPSAKALEIKETIEKEAMRRSLRRFQIARRDIVATMTFGNF